MANLDIRASWIEASPLLVPAINQMKFEDLIVVDF